MTDEKRGLVKEGHHTTDSHVVVLYAEQAVAWVFWRLGHPSGFGVTTDHESLSIPSSDEATTWVVVPHDDPDTAFWAGMHFSGKWQSLKYEQTTTKGHEPCNKWRAALVDAAMERLGDRVEVTPPKIIRSVILESLCIGVGLEDEDEI